MSPKATKEFVSFIKSFFMNKRKKINKIIFFGSYAVGKNLKDSDIDIAIVSEEFDGTDIFQRAEILKGLQWSLVEHFMIPFDIVPISLKEWKSKSSLMVKIIRETIHG